MPDPAVAHFWKAFRASGIVSDQARPAPLIVKDDRMPWRGPSAVGLYGRDKTHPELVRAQWLRVDRKPHCAWHVAVHDRPPSLGSRQYPVGTSRCFALLLRRGRGAVPGIFAEESGHSPDDPRNLTIGPGLPAEAFNRAHPSPLEAQALVSISSVPHMSCKSNVFRLQRFSS